MRLFNFTHTVTGLFMHEYQPNKLDKEKHYFCNIFYLILKKGLHM